MKTVEQMLKELPHIERMMLGQVRAMVQDANIDTSLATARAEQIERHFLPNESREMKIAVFLAGLAANLVSE